MTDNKTIEARNISAIPKNIDIAFLVSDFNKEQTEKMEAVAEEYLIKNYFKNISKFYVPGAYELPGMLQRILKEKKFDLIYCFGVIIKGDIDVNNYEEISRGIMEVTMKYPTPVGFGILVSENQKELETRINENITVSGLNLLSEVLKHNLG